MMWTHKISASPQKMATKGMLCFNVTQPFALEVCIQLKLPEISETIETQVRCLC